MIKKLTFILLAAGCTQVMYAQSTEKNEKFLENKTTQCDIIKDIGFIDESYKEIKPIAQ